MTKTKIAIHDSSSNDSKAINRQLLENLSEDYDIVFSKLHGRLFHLHQTMKPKLLLWSSSEYTQEFHDYIVEHQKDTCIILLVDYPIDQSDLVNFLQQSNVNIVLNKRTETNVKTIAEYDTLYEDSIFFDTGSDRLDKTLVLLSPDNKDNEIIKEICYPNTNHKIVAVGNPEFDSPINLGIYNLPDLAFMFNRFKSVIDVTGNAVLPAQACSAPCIDTTNLKNNFTNNVYIQPIDNINELTFKYFAEKNIIPFIRNKV